nr:hypothetical protein BaRGS_032056 [Batillaria attramentaria]
MKVKLPPEDSDLNPDGLEFGTREPTEEEGGVAVSVPEDRTDVGDMVINLLELCNQFDLASAVRSCDEWDGQTMVVDNEGEDVGGSP